MDFIGEGYYKLKGEEGHRCEMKLTFGGRSNHVMVRLSENQRSESVNEWVESSIDLTLEDAKKLVEFLTKYIELGEDTE